MITVLRSCAKDVSGNRLAGMVDGVARNNYYAYAEAEQALASQQPRIAHVMGMIGSSAMALAQTKYPKEYEKQEEAQKEKRSDELQEARKRNSQFTVIN